MDEHIKPAVLLLAAEIIRERGQQVDGGYVLDQVKLMISHDGYTVSLSNQLVTLHLYFHNKIGIECQKAKDVDDFYDRLVKISKMDD